MEEKIYESAYELILCAGNSKSNSMLAIQNAKQFNFEQAGIYLKEAQKELQNAHKVQTNMIQAEARGEKQELNIMMVHAQDHLTMALMTIERAQEMIDIYRNIKLLRNE